MKIGYVVGFYTPLAHKANTSVGPKPKILQEPQLVFFGTEKLEQFRFQSIKAPIPKF